MPNLTAVQQAELLASTTNRDFFLERFYKIPIVGKGPSPLKLRDFAKDLFSIMDVNHYIVGLKARQIGWTTSGVAFAVHDSWFNQEHPWLFVSKTEDAAVKMLAKAKYALNRMPKWLRDSMPSWSATQTAITFTNGSRIESVPATGSTGRGDSVYGALLDESAHMEYAEEIWAAVEPLIDKDGKALIFSSANGMGNFFHDIWLDSQQEISAWHGLFVPWSVVPERDQAWYDATRMAHRHRLWYFYQEYPTTPEEAFAKSGRVAFQAEEVAKAFEPREPEVRLGWTIGGVTRLLKADEVADIELEVWTSPFIERDERGTLLRKPNFVIGADFAEGLPHGDYTYITGFNCNLDGSGRVEQTFACKSSIPIAYSADLIQYLGYWYQTALVIGERNNAGIMPLELLGNDMWYPRLYRMDKFAEMPMEADRTPRYGWYTDKKSKSKMVNDFILALSEGQLIIHDPDFVVEAQTFIADGKGSFAATPNHHDDVVMGTLVAWQGVLDSPDYPIVWRDNRIQPITEDDIDKLFFPDEKPRSQYYTPIGRSKQREATVRSFILTPGNRP